MAEEGIFKRLLDPIIETAGLRPKIRASGKKRKRPHHPQPVTQNPSNHTAVHSYARFGPNSEGSSGRSLAK